MFYVDGVLVEPTEDKPEKNSKYGGREYKFYCPSCSSKALSINDTSYLFRCWSCGIEGKATTDNVIQIKEKMREVNSWRTEYVAQEEKKSKKPNKATTDKYIRLLIKDTTINEFVKGYLVDHNIPIGYARKYGIGYCDSTPEYPDRKVAEILGLVNERGNTRLYKRIIFPIRLGRLYTYVQGRRVGSSSKAKFLNMHGAAPFFNGSAIGEFDNVYVCEGIPDCLAMIAAGHLNCIAMLGAQSFSDDLVKQLEGKKVTFLLDGDKAGRAGVREAIRKLEGVAKEAGSIDIPDGLDVAEYIRSGKEIRLDGRKDTTTTDKEIKSSNEKRSISRNRMEDKDDTKETSNSIKLAAGDVETTANTIRGGRSKRNVSDEVGLQTDRGVRDTSSGERERVLTYLRSESNLLVFGYGDVGKIDNFDAIIEVSNVVERKTSLKANVRFEFKGSKEYGGSVNLASIRSRATFAKELAEQSKINELELKIILNDLNTGVRAQVETRKEAKIRKKEYVMSEDEKSEAIRFLRGDRILFRIKEGLTRQNIIGEDVNKILLYLIFTSRIMRKPVSSVIKGLSSSGKTHLMKQTMTLIPPEGMHVMQDATAKAFHYLDEDGLKHKMIVIGEMHGGEDSSYTIREAQDGIGDGDLIILTVEKDNDTNSMVTREKRVQGPCGFITSTTNPELHDENETRNFSLFVQVNAEKVKSTGKVLVDKYTGKSTLMNDNELRLFHNAQRCLSQGIEVRIPYVEHVLSQFPTDPIRVMRDRERFFTIIETIALFHQFQRDIHEDENGSKFIESTIGDYYIALMLLNEILIETLYELPPKSKEIYSTVVEMKGEHDKEHPPPDSTRFDDPNYEDPWIGSEADDKVFYATYKTLAEEMKMKPRDIKRWAKPLFENGYLQHLDDAHGGRSRETHMVPTLKTFYDTFLPSPEEVCEYMGVSSEIVYHPITGEIREVKIPEPEQQVESEEAPL